jgi:hypothetical protein
MVHLTDTHVYLSRFVLFCLSFPGVVAPLATRSTALFGQIPTEGMSESQLEIRQISEKWSKIRHMDRSEVESLEPEWLEAYNRFHERYDKDMENMIDIASKVKKMIDPVKVEKKTKGQRKRDKYAGVVAREAARASAVGK